jgi:hypothetical protein
MSRKVPSENCSSVCQAPRGRQCSYLPRKCGVPRLSRKSSISFSCGTATRSSLRIRFNRARRVRSWAFAICSRKSPPNGSFVKPTERSGSRISCGTTCRYRIDSKNAASSRKGRFALTCSRCVCVNRSGSFLSSRFGRSSSNWPSPSIRSFLIRARRCLSWLIPQFVSPSW